MGELDDGGETWVVRKDLTVAERPVTAAARAGAGGAYNGTLQDDQNHPAESEGGVGRNALTAAEKGEEAAHTTSLRGEG